MRILIFAGQAPFGSAIQQIVSANTGTLCYGVDLESGNEEVQEALNRVFASRLSDIVDETSKGPDACEYVICTDAQSSQAHILAGMWAETCQRNVLVMAGANVPMVLDAVYLKEDVDSLEELAKSLKAEAAAGLYSAVFKKQAGTGSVSLK